MVYIRKKQAMTETKRTAGTDNGVRQGCQHSFLDTPHGYMLSFSKQTHMYPFSLSY